MWNAYGVIRNYWKLAVELLSRIKRTSLVICSRRLTQSLNDTPNSTAMTLKSGNITVSHG
jgi:hypothetical protein